MEPIVPSANIPPTFSKEDVSLFMSITSQISQNGRNPIETQCPYCHTPITTELVITENEAASSDRSTGTTCICIIVTVPVIPALIFVAWRTGQWLAVLVMGAVLFSFFAFILWCQSWCQKSGHHFHDVTHYCPNCKEKLGVSDGQKEWREYARKK